MIRNARLLLIACALALACATIPSDPEAPTPDEMPLVLRAQAFCEQQGHPAGVPVSPFSTDGCTLWPDRAIAECCITHDIAYWCGGSAELRLEADRELGSCAKRSGYWSGGPVIRGVRMGGVPWLPTSWRWGYGHEFGSGYSKPTKPTNSAKPTDPTEP